MARVRIVLKDGREQEVRSYSVDDGRVELRLSDVGGASVALDDVDLARTFAANSGVDFDAQPEPPPPGQAVLELVSRNERETGDYLIVEGLVRNRGRAELVSVVAKVVGQDDKGEFVTGEEALIDWNPLRGRAESPFRVVVKSGGRVRRTRLSFRTLLGEALPTTGADD